MLGDSDAARYHAEAVLAPAEKAADRFSLVNAITLNVRLSTLVGDWAAAREFTDRGLVVAPLDARILFYRILLEYQEGDFIQGAAYVDRLREVMEMTTPGPTLDTVFLAMAITLAARISGEVERLELAEMAAKAALSSASAAHGTLLVARCALAFQAILEVDGEAADDLYGLLVLESGDYLVYGDINQNWVLGLLAETMGNLDQASVHFENSVTFSRQAGYRPELAWTCCDYADTLLQRNEPGDREKAMSLLDESLAISTELGMRPLMERVISRRDI
jgi:tetratricopeptide (TPR) repeat protein